MKGFLELLDSIVAIGVNQEARKQIIIYHSSTRPFH